MAASVELKVLAWQPSQIKQLQKKAVEWFRQFGRELPWRQTNDPYAIWISEIMLQQTQVATVIPYYHRFLDSFPTIESLAKATQDDIYHHWAGLGYYRRARQMHLAAQEIAQSHQGVFPTTFNEVLALPGIGRYTAGAILSFSSDQRLPIVEANTQRLYARLLHLSEDTASADSQGQLWSFAESVLPKQMGSGQLNQALMEIGSQVCLPKNPLCSACPLNRLCPTYASGSQALIPAPKKPKIYTDLQEAAIVIRDKQGRYLMRRCTAEERWAGLWDFPRFDVTGVSTELAIKKRLMSKFQERFGKSVLIGNALHRLKHAVTRYRITLQSFEGELEGSKSDKWPTGLEVVWASSEQMSKLALSSSGKRLWKWLESV